MVLPDSHGVARAPWYSGVCPRSRFDFAYGGVTLFATAFQRLPLSLRFLTSRLSCRTDRQILQPPSSNACRLALDGFGLVPVRSPLLGESRLISFPPGTEMVQFPGFALCSPAFPGLGFPIRKSPCRRSLASSTGLIAGSYVLHRLLMPRHPPYALIHLTQFSLFSRSASMLRRRTRRTVARPGHEDRTSKLLARTTTLLSWLFRYPRGPVRQRRRLACHHSRAEF